MDRRAFVAVILAAVITRHAVAAENPTRVYHIGIAWLQPNPNDNTDLRRALMEGLRGFGYVEGRDVVLEEIMGDGSWERMPEAIRELVRRKPDIIVAGVNQAIAIAKGATSTIPIVMIHATDPVGAGFVASLSHPGGNITGSAWDPTPELLAKGLQLAKDIVPRVKRVATLWDPGIPGMAAYWHELTLTAQTIGVALQRIDVRAANDFEAAFTAMRRAAPDVLLVSTGPIFYFNRRRIVSLAVANRLPTVYPYRDFVDAGGLVSYGPDLLSFWRRAAHYIDRILRGARPADLPVEQASQFELVVNLKTAKALGLTMPPALLLRADHVIE